jgi:hypothetical protein
MIGPPVTTNRVAALGLALALAGCAVVDQGPSLSDAQTAMTLLKFSNNGLPTDLSVTARLDRPDGGYRTGDPITLTVTVNKPASIAVLRVTRGGGTTIVFPNRNQPDARPPNGVAHVTVLAGPEGTELFEFIAATDATAWIFTKKPAASSDYVNLGSTTRATVTDLETTFRHAERGTVAVSHQAIKIGG